MKHSKAGGFTLVEVVIVFSITSALTVIALKGFSTLRSTTQFRDSIEQVKETVLAQRSQALASVNTAASGGIDKTKINLGQVLEFTPGSSTIVLQSLITTDSRSDPSANPAVTRITSDPPSANIRWGLTYSGYSTNGGASIVAGSYNVVFTRSRLSAKPQASGSTVLPSSYNQVLPGAGTVKLYFKDPDGRQADVDINFANGGITRSFQ